MKNFTVLYTDSTDTTFPKAWTTSHKDSKGAARAFYLNHDDVSCVILTVTELPQRPSRKFKRSVVMGY